MKLYLILLTLLGAPAAALAQNTDTQSDSYVCYHGQANDPATDAACARVQASSSQSSAAPAENETATAAPSSQTATAAPPTAPTAALPAAAPSPTDVGESPVASATQNADEDAGANADQGSADENVSIHGSWLAGLGVFAVVVGIIVGLIALAIYFIPTMIALGRRKHNALGIFALNLFLGWSFIGWAAALVWSLSSEPTGRR